MTTTQIITTYVLNNACQVSPMPMQPEDNSVTPYSVVPQSESAQRMDERLDKVQQWLETLEWPKTKTTKCSCSIVQNSSLLTISCGERTQQDSINSLYHQCSTYFSLQWHTTT